MKAHIVGESSIAAIDAGDKTELPYEKSFRDGAILYPRVLLLVNRQAAGPLGLGGDRVDVESARSPLEKPPWKSIGGLKGVVEGRFIKGMHLGETVAPFRALQARDSVLPVDESHILSQAEVDYHPALSTWWEGVEEAWRAGRSKGEKASLRERMDYHGQLSAQLPIRTNRVVYTKSGSTLFATRIPDDDKSVIDHKHFWGSFDSADEALYLVGLLNSKHLLKEVARYQAKGLFGARDFDKYVFRARKPEFDPLNADHRSVVDVASECEMVAARVTTPGSTGYTQARKLVEAALVATGARKRMEEAAIRVLPEFPGNPGLHTGGPLLSAPSIQQ